MTATLDLLERATRAAASPTPPKQRSVLIEITPEGSTTAEPLLPSIPPIEADLLPALTEDERAHLLDLLAKVLTRTAAVAADPPEPLQGERNRPARLAHGTPTATGV